MALAMFVYNETNIGFGPYYVKVIVPLIRTAPSFPRSGVLVTAGVTFVRLGKRFSFSALLAAFCQA